MLSIRPKRIGCPPPDASSPKFEHYFRLVDTIPPKEQDFHSQKMLQPARRFGDKECVARALSLLKSYQECLMKQKLTTLRKKKIVMITLPPESGVVLKTFEGTHHSWWRARDFDAVPYCRRADGEDVG